MPLGAPPERSAALLTAAVRDDTTRERMHLCMDVHYVLPSYHRYNATTRMIFCAELGRNHALSLSPRPPPPPSPHRDDGLTSFSRVFVLLLAFSHPGQEANNLRAHASTSTTYYNNTDSVLCMSCRNVALALAEESLATSREPSPQLRSNACMSPFKPPGPQPQKPPKGGRQQELANQRPGLACATSEQISAHHARAAG